MSRSSQNITAIFHMNQFEIFHPPVGKGAYSTCYRVIRKSDKKLGCLKVSKVCMNAADQIKVEEEFQLQSKFKHKNIIEAYEEFWDQGYYCVFMELAQNGSLRERVRQSLPEEEILRFLYEITDGLRHIHSHKIMHGDLKPDNILLDSTNHVKICDFGFACSLEEMHQSSMTMTGTPSYIAPELWDHDESVFVNDVWSLGVIIYELCCGSVPFSAKTRNLLKKSIKYSSIFPLPSHFSPLIYKLIFDMLQKNPISRPTISSIMFQIHPPIQITYSNFDQMQYSQY
jgi:serine/threonine protein kinase